MDGRIAALQRCQVQDCTRTSFRVGVKPLTRNGEKVFLQGQLVFTDAFGATFTVAS